jgi:hypothetical protein
MQRQAVVFNGQEVGIVVAEESRLRFVAVRFHVIALDNMVFDSLTDIRRAISQHLAANVSQHAEALADVRAFRHPMRDAWPSNS